MEYSDFIKNVVDNISTIGNGVVLKPSQIQNAGMGLFADRDFLRDEIITFYDGPIVAWRKLPKAKQQWSNFPDDVKSHIRKLFKDHYFLWGNADMDGNLLKDISNESLKGRGGLAFANDAFSSRFYNNAEFEQINGPSITQQLEVAGTGPEGTFAPDPFDTVVIMRARFNIAKGKELFVHYGDDYWREFGKVEDAKNVITVEDLRNAIYRPDNTSSVPVAAANAKKKKKRRVVPVSVTESPLVSDNN